MGLKEIFGKGFVGCVHLNRDKDKVLILMYSRKDNKYLGHIPNEQRQFVECLKKAMGFSFEDSMAWSTVVDSSRRIQLVGISALLAFFKLSKNPMICLVVLLLILASSSITINW